MPTLVNFGDCGDGSGNCLPISKGWNYGRYARSESHHNPQNQTSS